MIFRIYFTDLRTQAREEKTYFYRNPRGTRYERLVTDGSLGNFRLVSQKPLIIRHGNYKYTFRRTYIELEVDESVYEGIEMRDIFLSARFGALMGTLGMLDVKKILHVVRRHKWINGVLTPINRREMDTDAFGRPFTLIVYEYPHLRRIVIYIFRSPRISRTRAVDRLSEIIGISKSDIREHINRAVSEDYIEEVEYDYYHPSRYPLLAVLETSKAEGSYSLTGLRSELRKYMSTGEAEFAVYLAIDSGWVVRTNRRMFATPIGLAELKKLPKAQKRKGLVATAKGRNFVFGR